MSYMKDYFVEDLENGIFLFRKNMFSNIFIVTKEGVIATDPISAETAKLYREAIEKKTDKPVKYLIYSHDHTDHIAGGHIFKDTAKIISHVTVKDILQKRGNPEIAAPDITFEKKFTLTLGEKNVELISFGPGHSTSSIAIYLREDRLMMMVDIVSPNSVPFQDFPDINIRGFINTLKELNKIDYERYVYGHGPLGNKAHLPRLIQYMEDLIYETGEASKNITYDTVLKSVKGEMSDYPKIVNKTFDLIIETVIKKLRTRYSSLYAFEEWCPLNIRRIIHYHYMEN